MGKLCNKLHLKDAAYIAGILDGEGCITLSKKKDPTMKLGYGLRPHIMVTNTNKSLIKYLRDTTDLGIIYEGKLTNPKHKPNFRWQLWSLQAQSLLKEVLPYLLIKRKQAELLLEYIDRCSGKKGGFLSASMLKYQAKTCDKMRKLNKRGL